MQVEGLRHLTLRQVAPGASAKVPADVMMEVDWSVGEIPAALERGGIADNTLVVFAADNGPWLNFSEHASSAGPISERKGIMWEGDYYESCVMRWPKRNPRGNKR